ncbi:MULTISPECIES: alpha/beta fold hydrolase [unclassified Streptomyces]|uniref:alpha/beta fold hydrolase n=1 Tax=unclassified Streptomyces TaxID=2593676 RepID=UPI00225B8CB1|nr:MULTISPECIES: alpha/beta hydrolase [unclassified Streptomyces]MCX4408357.1 alpha/beta hydrolase [Streptomyces sp. NBC_01764]MCX5186103.1 alpha/beta hydrolase [Streptomyces sp. NBC_00268]
MPLLVCLPGGGYNASYFDVPGYSLVDAARREGFPVVSLDRPGYGGSTALGGEISFRRNAQVLQGAIAELWHRYLPNASGIVLVGHSIGGAIALHLAAGDRTWPLLGVSVTGIHDESQRSNEALKSEPPASSMEFSREHLLQFMYGPEDTYDPSVLGIAKHAESPVPIAELVEVAGQWCMDFAGIAARIEVPLHYGLAEHEGFWHSSDESVAAFGNAFTAAPSVTARRILGGGHNIDHHYVGAAFHKEQLDFAKGLVSPAQSWRTGLS